MLKETGSIVGRENTFSIVWNVAAVLCDSNEKFLVFEKHPAYLLTKLIVVSAVLNIKHHE